MPIWRLNSSVAIVRKYIRAINTHDFSAAEQLMCPKMTMIDSAGLAVSGRADCLAVLSSLASHSPEYRIEISALSRRGGYVLVSGQAHSHDPRLARTTQWRARVCDGKLTEWQAYAAYPQHSDVDAHDLGVEHFAMSPMQALATVQG